MLITSFAAVWRATHTAAVSTHSAANFSLDELVEVMSYLHARGVKGFVTLNVLVFDEELPAVEQRIRAMAEAGVDAVIVQVPSDGPLPVSRSACP